MKRIFSDYAYGPETRRGCWWDETIGAPDWPRLDGDQNVDVAIIGAGFTGASAALHLAQAGVSVAVLEAETPGWGASGRNGGFCCLGGAKMTSAQMERTYGTDAANAFSQAEKDAVDLVSDLLKQFEIDADTHSKGETLLAHRPKDMEQLRKSAEMMAQKEGGDPILIEAQNLAAYGMNGPFHGALTIPHGFALNPRKYLFGLASAAMQAGASLYQKSQVIRINSDSNGHVLSTAHGRLRSKTVLIATNGYSSEDLPTWLAGRFIPSQSNVLVTRPLTDAELQAQGWTSGQMSYDTRNLLHYFRLMPDRRFLFGMRGGLLSSAASEARARTQTRKHFECMFPEWRSVPSHNSWSGMVCISRNRVPFVGPVPGQSDMFAALAYHGNGVAMGSYCGKLLANLALNNATDPPVPVPMQKPMRRFPLGPARRMLMFPVYGAMGLKDI